MIYRLILSLRNAWYKGGRHSAEASVPTICVGNITVGGTGKTPHTEMLLRLLEQSPRWAMRSIAVLSLGYKRRSRGFQQVPADGSASFYGDEPVQLKRKFPQVTVAVDKDLEDWYQSYLAYMKAERRVNGGGGVLLGSTVIPEMEVSRALIERKAAENDVVVLTVSRNAGEGADRKAADGDWSLTGQERQLLQTLADVCHQNGKKLVVVLNIGGVIETASWKHIPDAILLAWTPGQEGGLAVADVLCGAANPSGKLPMTFPVSYFDIPSSDNFPSHFDRGGRSNVSSVSNNGKAPVKDIDYTDYTEGIWVGYRYFATAGKAVSYPFGYGLSYTTFAYSKPAVKVDKAGNVTATVTVTNTGDKAARDSAHMFNNSSCTNSCIEKASSKLPVFERAKLPNHGNSRTKTVLQTELLLIWFII